MIIAWVNLMFNIITIEKKNITIIHLKHIQKHHNLISAAIKIWPEQINHILTSYI